MVPAPKPTLQGISFCLLRRPLLVAFIVSVALAATSSLASRSSTEESQSLNGAWRFRVDPARVAESQRWFDPKRTTQSWDALEVPGNWDTVNEYANYVGQAVYRRSFVTPESWYGSRISLRFGAVYQRATVYLNGLYLGSHTGGYTPFEFAVDDLLLEDGENVLTVIADNSYDRGAWWNWGGISRGVKLVRHGKARVLWQKITAEPDLEAGRAVVTVRAMVRNETDGELELEFTNALCADHQARVPWGPQQIASQSSRVEIPAYRATEVSQEFVLSGDKIRLWHFDTPYLYRCRTTVSEDSEAVHTVIDRFGIREVKVSGTSLLLNGEAIRANGFNRVSDHRAWGNSEPTDFVRREADLLKSNGCVLARLSHVPLSPDLLDYLDEIGMLIIEEIPVWGADDPQAFGNNPLPRAWLEEMISRDFNHPCIIGWSVANEIAWRGRGWKTMRIAPPQYSYVRSMFDHIRSQLDSSRLLTYASFTVFREGANPDNDPASLCDVISVNCYGDALAQVASVHEKWPHKPIFISEFGKGQVGLDPNEASLKDALFPAMDALRQDHPYVIGWSWWAFTDYRSRFKGTPPSQNRAWGFYNVWRQPKRAQMQLAPEHAPVRRLALNVYAAEHKAMISFEPRFQADIPSYTLYGYELQWSLHGPDGKTIQEGSESLPTIVPGDKMKKWEISGLLHIEQASRMEARLVTVTGHVVHRTHVALRPPPTPTITTLYGSDGRFRVEFDLVPGADAYRIRYVCGGNEALSDPTINPDFEAKGLPQGKQCVVSVYAINGAGQSSASGEKTITTSGDPLPPVVWHAGPAAEGFVVGYSVSEVDESFTLAYSRRGEGKRVLLAELPLKGSVAVRDLVPGWYTYRLRREGLYGTSQWTQPRDVRVTHDR